ncbi:probable protein phosphatase 2C 25 [Neltuma alba]|uniref:probable protein phosphatase 2C 25 n=1 Tax=Neltuma alba TaxID=207710 RepID=UPI0010A3C9C2|nr:probable protein phosphatase 2C 25 [Prosopis alba]XP_028804865.1 probable protein phosphatase 2C 25 [Prosopis alba]
MSCSVAVSNSPVFSPSSSLFCNKPSVISSSPESLSLSLSHLKPSTSVSSSSSSPSSPSSPFRLRLLKPPPPTALSNSASVSAPSSSTSPTGTVLKRKRPARLDIPVSSLTFGVPATPSSSVARDVLEAEGHGFSVYCKRGRREYMEDRYSAAVNLQGQPKQAFFGIFDGHGGSKAAEFAAQNLEKNVMDEVTRRDEDDMEEAVKHGYLNTDSDFLKGDLRGGSCCATALIRNGNLVVSNAGDCRAVISRGGVAEALTSDHRPSREDEKDRIETTGGYVDFCRGVWRIQGSLAVSRGIGDRYLKQWVIAEPETKVLRIEPEHDLLILASDGLWDKVTNQEAVDIARPLCNGASNMAQPLMACKRLVDLSVSRGSSDDISVMLVKLGQFI